MARLTDRPATAPIVAVMSSSTTGGMAESTVSVISARARPHVPGDLHARDVDPFAAQDLAHTPTMPGRSV